MKNFIKFLLLIGFFSVPLLASAKTFDSNLYFGITNNPDVQMLQEFLTDQGVYSGPITGNFFSLTLVAVKKYQAQNNITPAAGFFGPITRAKANEILSAQTQSSDSQAITETGTTAPPVTQNTITNNNQSLMQTLMTQILALTQQIAQIQQQNQNNQQNTQTPTQPTQTTQQTTQQTQINTQTQSTPTQTAQVSPSPASPTDTIPPVISDVKSTNVAPYSATITWISNEYSDSAVYLGLSSGAYFSSANGSVSAMNSGYFHTVNLSSLTANKKYYYKVTSADNNNNRSASNEYDFTTASIPPGSITVMKNTAFAFNVTAAMKPSTVAQAVKIGSYVLTASYADDVTITSLVLQVANVSYIQNLKIKLGDAQFGSTQSILPGGTYSFIGTPFIVAKGSTVYVDVYADITSSTSGVTTVAVTTMTGLVGSGATSLNSISLPSNVPGQDVTITITSNLTATSDATGIITNGHVRSTADHMATFVFTADPANDVTIHTVTLHLNGTSLAAGAVRLIDSDTGLDWGSATTWNSSISDSIVFFPNYILSAGSTKRVKVQMNTINFIATAGSVNGSLAQWSIANGADAAHNYNAVDWSIGSGDHYNLDASKLPIYGPSIRY